MDDRDAGVLSIRRAPPVDEGSVPTQSARRRAFGSGDDFDESGLAGAVGADKSVHAARGEFKGDPSKGARASRIHLGYVLNRERWNPSALGSEGAGWSSYHCGTHWSTFASVIAGVS